MPKNITTIEAIVVSDSSSLLSSGAQVTARKEGWDIRMKGDRPDIFLVNEGLSYLPTAQFIHLEAQRGTEAHLEAIRILRGKVVENLFRVALEDSRLVAGASPRRACMQSGWRDTWGFAPSELKYLGLKQVAKYGYWAAYHEVVNPKELLLHSDFEGWEINGSLSKQKPQIHGHIYWLNQHGIARKERGWEIESLRDINVKWDSDTDSLYSLVSFQQASFPFPSNSSARSIEGALV